MEGTFFPPYIFQTYLIKRVLSLQLEKGGKAESSGLFVGDILYSINSVILTGSRDDAVRMVKTSGYYLTVEVER